MNIAKWGVAVLVASAMSLNTGCIIISGSWDQHTVWTEEVTDRIPIDATELQNVEVKTHNGAISYEEATGEAYVLVKKKAGGHCHADAENAMQALEVFVHHNRGGTCRIGYKWSGGRRSTWRAAVAFEIHGPADVDLEVETHNGTVSAAHLRGDVDIETHNGGVRAATTGDRMTVETHNGPINATFGGRSLKLVTHNGSVTADITECGPVEGQITTHNGSVEVLVGPTTSMDFDCRTHNGRIRCSAPLQSVVAQRRSLKGTIGDGADGKLDVETHNGSVRVTDMEG